MLINLSKNQYSMCTNLTISYFLGITVAKKTFIIKLDIKIVSKKRNFMLLPDSIIDFYSLLLVASEWTIILQFGKKTFKLFSDAK